MTVHDGLCWLLRARAPTRNTEPHKQVSATGSSWATVVVGCWVRVIGKSMSFGQELLPTLLTQHQQQQERPTLPNAQDRFLLPVHRVWWSGLFVYLLC